MNHRCLACGVLAALLAGCAARPASPASSDAPIDADTAELVVLGLGCPLCANNIDEQLARVPGVTSAAVNLGDGTVRLRFDPAARPSRADLASAVDRAGFTLEEIRVP